MKNIKSIYGCLWLDNGKEIDLDGSIAEPFNPNKILSIGEHEIGDDANIHIQFEDDSVLIIRTVDSAKNFFTEFFEDYKNKGVK